MAVSVRVAQIYGYAVCLIAVVVFLISTSGAVDAAFDLARPLASWRGGDPMLASFELYKANYPVRMRPTPPGEPQEPEPPDEATLRRMYEAQREAQIEGARFQAGKSLVRNALLLIISAVLFLVHWRWLRRGEATEG